MSFCIGNYWPSDCCGYFLTCSPNFEPPFVLGLIRQVGLVKHFFLKEKELFFLIFYFGKLFLFWECYSYSLAPFPTAGFCAQQRKSFSACAKLTIFSWSCCFWGNNTIFFSILGLPFEYKSVKLELFDLRFCIELSSTTNYSISRLV